MPYFFYFLIFSSYFPFTFLLLIFFFYFSFPFLISTASRPSPVAYLFASSQPQRTHTRPPRGFSSNADAVPTSGLLYCAPSPSTKSAPAVPSPSSSPLPSSSTPATRGCESIDRPSSALFSDAGGPCGDRPRAGEPLRASDRALQAAELPRMASGAAPEARRRGRFNSASSTGLPAGDEDDSVSVSVSASIDRRNSAYLRREPASAGGHLLRPPSSRAHKTAMPLLPAPCNCRAPMDPTGGRAGKGPGGAAGEPVFAAPPRRPFGRASSKTARGAAAEALPNGPLKSAVLHCFLVGAPHKRCL
jgi:hypothetical protein